MQKKILSIILTVCFFNLGFSQSNPANSNKIENFRLGVVAEKDKDKTKVMFNDKLYNFESIYKLGDYSERINIKIVKDSTTISKLLNKPNNSNLQIILIEMINYNLALEDDLLRILKPYLYQIAHCKTN
ncbi:MAG: hypothetical protein HEQ40_13690 [Lacibacter sp.]|jgi:hypothetical protein